MLNKVVQEELIGQIAELGGKSFKEEDIVFEGAKLVLPEQFRGDMDKAIVFIKRRIKEDEETAQFQRSFPYRPWDGALCAYRAMKRAFGMVHGKIVHTVFGDNPPQYIQIPISPTETEEVPWGQFQIPLLEKSLINFSMTYDQEHGQIFEVIVEAPRKHRFIVEGLFKLIAAELETGSIYRGHAIDGQQQPNFLDLSSLDKSKIVYSEQVTVDLEANIWSVMRFPEQQKALGLPLKRAILLYGTYGVGKSLAGFLTADEAVRNGWTFLMARPGRDDFLTVMQTARLYQPACIFFEDAENIAGAESNDMITEILDTFDGVQAKGLNLMVVLTTNHPDLIHKGMHRPGRVDSQIEIGSLDEKGIEKLVRALIPTNKLSPNIDFTPIIEACEGFVPAFIKEMADRAVRYALVRTDGELNEIETHDLVNAANGLRPQFLRMQEAPESTTGEKTLSTLVKEAAQEGVGEIAASAEASSSAVWNSSKLQEAQNRSNHK